jgi:hypothetical protein
MLCRTDLEVPTCCCRRGRQFWGTTDRLPSVREQILKLKPKFNEFPIVYGW